MRLGERTIVVAPRIVLGDGVEIGDDSAVDCDEVFAVGALTSFGARLDVACRRVFIGANGYFGRDVRVGGGGRRDPWATLAVGDLAFVGDEAFINPCRPVVIGREVFVTMRSMLVTHNIGHSVLEGFENRFAPIVLEDRAQVGLGTVVYAGCRLGREAIVASNSYVVSDIPAGQLAIGVPAKPVGVSARPVPRTRQPQLVRRLLDDFRELLELRGVDVAAGSDHSVAVRVDGTTSLVLFAEKVDAKFEPPETDGEVVVLTLDARRRPACGLRRARSRGAARPRRRRCRARLGPRALPQARHPPRARSLAVPRRAHLAVVRYAQPEGSDSQGGHMGIKIGDTAPDFQAETTEGPISFHDWIGDSWAVLFSHPKDFTPVCTTELGYMAKIKPEFDKRDVKVIGLSVDSTGDHEGWAKDIEETQGHAPNYPIIGDSDFAVSKLYGMLPAETEGDPKARTPMDNQTVRNVFVVGPDKKVKLVLVYPMTTGRNFDEVLRVIDSLQLTARHRVATPVNWQAGEDVIIAGSVQNDEAKEIFGEWEEPKPYIRIVPQPDMTRVEA